MKNFTVYPVGTRVRANCWKESSNIAERETKGWVEGIIFTYIGDIVRLRTDGGGFTDRWSETVIPIFPTIEAGTPVKQRCGRKAIVIECSEDPDRPIVALVQMEDGTERKLSYSKFGYFYKYEPLPVDLVPIE